VLDRESEAKLLKLVASDRRSNVLEAPRITTFSGQTASASDIAYSQFVVGETLLPCGKRELKTRDVAEGTTIQVRPVAESNGDLGLSFSASFSRIAQVTCENRKIAPDRELVLRIPHVSTVCIEGRVALKPGQSLVLGGVKGFAEAMEVSSTDKSPDGRLDPKKREVQPVELVVLVRVEPESGGR
jgi:type II secretory pathway component GspD/PulD (secretin)